GVLEVRNELVAAPAPAPTLAEAKVEAGATSEPVPEGAVTSEPRLEPHGREQDADRVTKPAPGGERVPIADTRAGQAPGPGAPGRPVCPIHRTDRVPVPRLRPRARAQRSALATGGGAVPALRPRRRAVHGIHAPGRHDVQPPRPDFPARRSL